jgi:hypothetical protein
MANENLGNAKREKNDEFYTQYADIEKEMNAYLEFDPHVFRNKTVLLPCDDPEWSNFTKYFAQRFQDLGLKKLISTSYAPNSKPKDIPYQPTLFEIDSPEFDEEKTYENGKIFTLTRDTTGDDAINVDDLEWSYLKGDGDFRSDEITALRDEADIIITNPPFSLFREFLAWLAEGEKKFVVLGNMNAITYKEVFPLIKSNKIWAGTKPFGGGMDMIMPTGAFDSEKAGIYSTNELGQFVKNIMGVIWFSNLDHGRRHQPLSLMTMEENLKFNKAVKDVGYQKYDNYDAIEVPRTDAIPSDFDGVMGVPITFLGKYNPDQFEILGISKAWDLSSGLRVKTYPKQIQVTSDGKEAEVTKLNDAPALQISGSPSGTFYKVNGKLYEATYQRLLIRHVEAER